MTAALQTRSTFFRNIFELAGGTALAQGIALLLAPLLTRLYPPASFGAFALFSAAVAILGLVATGRYELAVMLPEDDSEAWRLVVLAIVLSAAASVATAVMGAASSLCGFHPFGLDGTSLLLLPLSIFVFGGWQALSYWFSREKRYRRIAANKFTLSASTAAASIVYAPLSLFNGLVAGMATGQTIAALNLFVLVRRSGYSTSFPGFTALRDAARKYKQFPLHGMPGALFDLMSLQAPIYFLAAAYGSAAAGEFSLLQRVLGGPAALVSYAVGQVYYQRIARTGTTGDVQRDVRRVARGLLMVAAPALVVVALAAPAVFPVVFGETWRHAGESARILAGVFAVRFVVSPLTLALPATRNTFAAFAWQLSYFITTVTTLTVASRFSIDTFFYVYLIHETVMYGIYFITIDRATGATCGPAGSLAAPTGGS